MGQQFRVVVFDVNHLEGLHLVEDGLGELVGGRDTAHVASADLAVEVVSIGCYLLVEEKLTLRQ